MLDPNFATARRRSSFAPPLEEASDDRRRSRRISAFLDALNPRRMQDAPVEERIAALRRLREARAAANPEDEAETHRRRRLTARLGSVFGVRTGPAASNAEGSAGGDSRLQTSGRNPRVPPPLATIESEDAERPASQARNQSRDRSGRASRQSSMMGRGTRSDSRADTRRSGTFGGPTM